MISIFNGRKRSLGDAQTSVFAQLSVEFRHHLHKFKGARLHVFLCVALHADDKGWAYPTLEACIRRETGYNRETIIHALNELCQLTIEGHRVLLAHQPTNGDGTFRPNQYLIFPTAEEVAQYETNNSHRRQPRDSKPPSAGNPDSVRPSAGFPNTVKPNSGNPHSKKNHSEPEPAEGKPIKPDDDDAPWARQIIHEVLSGRGIDDPVPSELATQLGGRIDSVEIMMYAVQRAENNAATHLDARNNSVGQDAQHAREPIRASDEAAQRQSDIETNANGLLIYRLRKKAPDSQAKMLRAIQAARSAGIDAWLIGAGADAITVSLWREQQDGLLRAAGLDLIDVPTSTQPTYATPTSQRSNAAARSTPAIPPAQNPPNCEPTGKHITAWNYTRTALALKHGQGTYAKWLHMTKLIAADGTHFVVSLPTQYSSDWFAQRITPDLKAGLAQRLGCASDDIAITVVVNSALKLSNSDCTSVHHMHKGAA